MRNFTLRLPKKLQWFNLKVVLLATSLFFLAGLTTNAQTNIANYAYAASTGNTYTPITGGTTAFSGAYDNTVSAAIPLGATFTFGGANFTTCYISTNGFITFGAAPGAATYTPISILGTTTGAISAFGQDAGGSSVTGAVPLISYVNTGTEFVVQYADHANYFNRTQERLNFQIRLTFATGAINIIYGTCTNPGTVSTSGTSIQVGIRGNSVTWADNVNSLLAGNIPANTTCDWSNAVAGNANTSALLFSGTTNVNVKIPAGLQYTWTPAAQAPVRTFAAVSGITSSDATITWTAPTGATQYNIRYRVPASCTWTNFSGNPVSGATATLTGLASATSYQVQVQASNGTADAIWSHIPTSAAGAGLNGYTATGTFTTTANACTGTPTPGSSAVSTYNLCQGSTQVLTVTGASTPATSTGITNQWDSSANGVSGWVPVTVGSGATTTTYTIAPFGSTTVYYRLRTTCTNGGLFDNSNIITINPPTVPATQASAFTTTAIGSTTATLSWTNGNGNNRSVFVNTTNSFTDPVTPASPGTAATLYANTGQQLVYDGTGTSVSITGLTGGTNYYVRVYENQKCATPASWYYNVTTATNNPGSFTTLVPPVNDLVCDALELIVDDPSPVCVNTTAASVTASDPDIASCSAPNNTVWFKFTPTVSAVHTITASVPIASIKGMTAWLFTYTATGTCPGALTFTAAGGISCGTATSATAGSTTVYSTTALTAGTTYYIYVDGNSGGFGDICFKVSGPAPMSYTSSAVTQSSTASVVAGSVNQQIVRVAVTVTGALSPLSLTQLDFNTNGTTDPGNIDSAKVFYTGTSTVFSTTTQFGTTVADPNGAFSVTGSQVLTGSGSTAVNYFWLVYDVDCAATAANVLDAECTSIDVSGPRTPTTPAPTGTRAITAASYTAVTLQPSTGVVAQGAVNAQILRVALTGCANAPVTEINFTTTGTTNAASDISAARVFYTTTTTFSTTTQFGSDFPNPDGAFTVSGSQPLTTGTGYFWLVYDVPASAPVADSIDASCVSAVTNGVTAIPATPNPTGKRAIVAPVLNDEAAGAITLTVNGDYACGATTVGTTLGATQSTEAAPSCSATGVDDDVWYTFTATGTAHRIVFSAVSTGTMVSALYTGTPGSLVFVTGACASTTLNATGLVAGTTYYVRVYNTATTSATQSNFTICVGTPPPPPPNDEATGAITLTVGAGCTTNPYDNSVATQSTNEPFPSCKGTAGYAGMWYKFVAPASGAVKVSCDGTGTLGDSRISLFAATNASDYATFTNIACDDDNGVIGSTRSLLYATGLTAGTTYYVLVDLYTSASAKGTYCVTVDELSASMITTTVGSCVTDQASVAGYNAAYTGWISLIDGTTGNLNALVRQITGTATGFGSSRTITTGASRVDAVGTAYLNRNFLINGSGATSAEVQLFFTNAELTSLGGTLAGLNVSRVAGTTCTSDYPGGATFLAQTGSGSAGGVSWVKVTTPGFSNFYLHQGNQPLPISLVYFNGTKSATANNLNWKVNCTSVSVSFDIERSANGRNFTSLGTLGATQARCLTPFDFADSKPLAGINYYRIKIIDVDGKVSYTNIVAINNKKSGIELVGIQPTLVQNEAILYIAAAKAGKLQIAVTDNVGRQIQTRTITVAEGDNKVSLNFGTLAAGVYNLSSINESTKSTIRFVKQ